MFMLGFPLLLIPFAIYNIIAFLMPGVTWATVVSTVHMVSGADWTMSAGEMLIALAVVLLCGEVIKSTRVGLRTVVEAVPVPVVGIGGVTVERVREVTQTGAAGVAVVNAVMSASDPASVVRRMLQSFADA